MIKQTISFVTTNAGKFQEVSQYFNELCPTIKIEQVEIDVPEIQSLDVEEIALNKAKYAWEVLKKPLIIDDGGIYLKQYHNFPGPLAKWIFKGIGLEGFWRLAENDPRALFLCKIVYIDGPENYKIVDGVLEGKIIKPHTIAKDVALPFTEIFVPNGFDQVFSIIKKTDEGKKLNHRYQAISSLVKLLSC